MKYRREIDGLRAIAVLPVILFHAGFGLFGGGFVGVDVFFVISGYLITSIIASELNDGKFSLLGFYERRVRRILPALLFVILVCLPFAWAWMVPGVFKDFSQSLVAVSVFSSNIFFWIKSGYFDGQAEQKPLLHTWSLAVEEQYYLLFPVFVLLMWRLGRRWMVAALVLFAICSLVIAQLGSDYSPSAAFYLLPARGWELLIGALIALYLNSGLERIGSGVMTVDQMLSSTGLISILFAVFVFNKFTPFPSLYALVPTLGAALIILFATPETMVGRLLSNSVLVGVGLVSYSAYLWHQPLFAFARLRNTERPGDLLFVALIVASLVLAYFTWRFIERPFRDRRRISGARVLIAALVVSGAVLGFGLFGHITRGYPDRTPPAHLPYDYFVQANTKFDIYGLDGNVCVSDSAHVCTLRDDPNSKKRIFMVGDSHSGDLVDEFRKYLNTNALSGAQMSVGGCFFIESHMRGIGNECRRARDIVEASIQQHMFDEYILVGNYLEHTEGMSDSLRHEDIASIVALVRSIVDSGSTVTVFEPRPNLLLDNVKAGMLGALDKQSIVELSATNVSAWKVALSQFEQNTNFRIFKQAAPIVEAGCGDVACFNGHTVLHEPIYRDNSHLTNYGAHVVFDAYARYDRDNTTMVAR